VAGIPQFTSRPEVQVVVYRHRPACNFTAPDRLGRCSCRKHLYVREARLRIATGKRSWEAAREFAANWMDAHDPAKIRERDRAARQEATYKLLDDAFDDFLETKRAASCNAEGFEATESKIRTIKKQLGIFTAVSINRRIDQSLVKSKHITRLPNLCPGAGWPSRIAVLDRYAV
jgi:hypothetical protein